MLAVDDHPLAAVLRAALQSDFPPANNAVEVLPPLDGPVDAVVDFSAHSYVIADLDHDEVRSNLPHTGPGATFNATFLTWLAGRLGTRPGVLDLVVVAYGTGKPDKELKARNDLWDHPRVISATRHRRELSLYSDARGAAVVTLGRGLVGRREVSIEIEREERGRGLGRRLARAALSLIPEGEPLFAQVSPGNIASVRAFLAAGYRPVCAEVMFLKAN